MEKKKLLLNYLELQNDRTSDTQIKMQLITVNYGTSTINLNFTAIILINITIVGCGELLEFTLLVRWPPQVTWLTG